MQVPRQVNKLNGRLEAIQPHNLCFTGAVSRVPNG